MSVATGDYALLDKYAQQILVSQELLLVAIRELRTLWLLLNAC